jgi:hypothetical protein
MQASSRQLFGFQSARYFGAPTQELLDNLKKIGIRNTNIVHNPT